MPVDMIMGRPVAATRRIRRQRATRVVCAGVAERRDRPVVAADLAFRGIPVTAGPHHVILRYVPVATLLGFVMVGLTVLVAGLAIAVLQRADRRAAKRHAGAS
jgi:hypothetical protein